MKKHQRLGLGALLFSLVMAVVFSDMPELAKGLHTVVINAVILTVAFIGSILLGAD